MLRSLVSRRMSAFANMRLPKVENEPMLDYRPGSAERAKLVAELKAIKSAGVVDIPCVVNGKEHFTGRIKEQVMPSRHGHVLARVHHATPALVTEAVDGALKARRDWSRLPYEARASVFLQAAEYLSTSDRASIMAATMLGQGKNTWQAEIDSAVETIDFWRFSATYGQDIYDMQPEHHSPGVWNKIEYRPLEGFVFGISPFNFTAIGANLVSAPIQMGNVAVWKPSDTAALSNWRVFQLLRRSGLPDGVLQFLPMDSSDGHHVINHKMMAGLHFTGSTGTFRKLYRQIADRIDQYHSFPRIVGETGGKNFHMVHRSADPEHVAYQTVRSAFEYSGQKCSACSRLYVPQTMWPAVRDLMVKELSKLKIGQPDEWDTFASAVIDRSSYSKITSYIDHASKDPSCKIIYGGTYSDAEGFFVQPTIIETTDPRSRTMEEEIFGPVLTVYVYNDAEYEKTMQLVSSTSPYALTGSIFARDRWAIERAHEELHDASGNFYINDKSTGAVVGQQPFGGSRASGTNDKAGFVMNLMRWVSPRTIKENFRPITAVTYPSMLPDKQQ